MKRRITYTVVAAAAAAAMAAAMAASSGDSDVWDGDILDDLL